MSGKIGFLVTVMLLWLFSGCSGRESFSELSGDVWTTSYHISYGSAQPIQDSIDRIFREIDRSLSMFNDSSLICRVNRNDTSVRVDRMLREIFGKSVAIYKASGGAFDPTVGPLVDLWGFGRSSGTSSAMPSDEGIAEALGKVGLGRCHIDSEGRLIKKSPETRFDFSAIAKGYACDRIAALFRRNNIRDFLIEIGGEIYAGGRNPEGEPWRIMIENPLDSSGITGNSSLKIVELSDRSIATSGNYRRFRYNTGRKISHIIDPKTGYPRSGDVISATVTAPDCMTADALATACMAMTADSALRMLKRFPDVEGLIVTEKSIIRNE
ncbi:MAG: FAD:protein FMN transferase [Muribaculaceae bacterium]|nr:FAD:protein FMN transferase [Muribaculaceae bacterium]